MRGARVTFNPPMPLDKRTCFLINLRDGLCCRASGGASPKADVTTNCG
jgi:hypothetical protein